MNACSFSVLRRLGDGDIHSGAALAGALGVSRGTVWNAIRAIEAAGIEVYKVRGRGYRVTSALSVLAPDAIAAHIERHAALFTIEVLDVAESTNTLLLERAQKGTPSGTVIAAEWQTQGRGRLGRAWHAAPFGALTFSLVWRFDRGSAALSGLSLAAGVALARALEKIGVRDVALKWPNDLICHGRKLAGILIEMQGDALGPSAVVIGIGLNVRLSKQVLESIDQPVVDLESIAGAAVDRNRVLGVMLDELAEVLERFAAEGFKPFRRDWERHHAHQDRAVEVRFARGGTERGVVRGVADDGALLLETSAGVQRLHSGEVSLRGVPSEAAAA